MISLYTGILIKTEIKISKLMRLFLFFSKIDKYSNTSLRATNRTNIMVNLKYIKNQKISEIKLKILKAV